MKNILLPTDFSINSLNAIEYAMEMFKGRSCDFYLLHVIKTSSFISDDLMTMTPYETLYTALIDASKKAIHKIIHKIKAKNKNGKHHFHTIVDYDNLIDSINQIGVSKKIDLIIMGTNGATGLEKVLFGSNTVRVFNHCNIPVLAIPKNYKFEKFESMVFTSNYLTLYNPIELDPLLQISKLNNSKINILHVFNDRYLSQSQENNKAFLEAYFSGTQHEFIDLNSDNFFEAVNSFINKNKVNLLSMMSRKHSFLENVFTTYKATSFTFNITVPFLVLGHQET